MFGIAEETVNLQARHGSTIRQTLGRTRLPWWLRLGYRLLAARCIFCTAAGDLGDIDLCERCLHALPWSTRPDCAPAASGTLTLFEYRTPISTALVALKFRADFRHAAVLGSLLGLSWKLAAESADCGPGALLVPIPLHPDRLRERGFNQVALIARYASHTSGVPIARHLLRRTQATLPQTRLDAGARRANVESAFEATADPEARERLLLLLDDVTTTGATLDAATTALSGIGYRVQPWAVARAMPANTTSPMD